MQAFAGRPNLRIALIWCRNGRLQYDLHNVYSWGWENSTQIFNFRFSERTQNDL